MIVLDSSAAADYLLGLEPEATWVHGHLAANRGAVHAPHVFDVEVAKVLRTFVQQRWMAADHGLVRLRALVDLDVRRYPHTQLLERAWELRSNMIVSDACFVALAEAIDAPLVTTDRRLARARGPRIPVLAP